MSLDDLDRRYAEWEQQQADTTPAPASTLNEEDALQMGLLHPEKEQPPQENIQEENVQQEEPQGDSFIDYLNSDKEYEKLDFWQSQGDMLKAVGTEFSHFFMPKHLEKQYEAKTHYAENMKYLYRYGVGTAAFLLGGEVAAGVKGLGLVGKGISLAGKALTFKPMNVMTKGLQAARAGKNAKAAIMGAKAINGAVEGVVAGALADYNLYRPEENEGQLADILGDNKLVGFLQSNPNAPEYQERLKNVINGLILAVPLGSGIEVGIKPLLAKQLQGLHKAINGKTQKAVEEGILEHTTASEALDNKAQTLDLWEQIKALKQTADESGEELDKLIVDNIPQAKQADARTMGNIAEQGKDIFPNADGTFSLRVEKYQDAYQVPFEEYQRQLSELDPTGELGIQHQNEAVRDTWVNRGWIGENEELTPQNANKIAEYYQDKWGLKKKPKIQFTDGLVVKGEKVDGTTLANGTIRIDTNAKNPFATLRSELEHHRDLKLKQVPNQAERHFARYNGLNEAEVAPFYTYKKSYGRAEALKMENSKLNQWRISDKAQSITLNDALDHVEAFKGQGYIDDVADVEVRHLTDDMRTDLEGKPKGGGTKLENWKPVIYTDTNLPPEVVEENLYHELQHTRQWKEAVEEYAQGKPEKYNELLQFAKDVNEGKYTLEEYENHHIEAEANNTKEFLKYTKEQYNARRKQQAFSGRNRINQQLDGVQNQGERQYNTIEKTGNERGGSKENSVRESGIGTSNQQPEQLKLDFNPKINETQNTDELVNSLSKGEIKVTSVEDLEAAITKFEELDPEISGKKFIDVAQDSDSWFNQKINEGTVEDAVAYAKSLDVEDAKIVDKIVRKQIATSKLLQLLQGQLAKANDENLGDIITTLKNVSLYAEEYNKAIASAMGRGLRYQKLNKQALEEFATAGLSQAEKNGLLDIADVVNQLYKDTLNFTLNSPKEIKAAFWKNLEKTDFYNAAMQDKGLFKNMNKILDDCITSKENFSPSQITKKMADMISKEDIQRAAWYVKLCDNSESIKNVMNKWSRNTAAYMINNVLGFKSLMNNVIGAGRTLTFPMNKVLGGMLSGNPYITKEGIRTYQNMFINFGESLRMAKQAFLNGDGVLTNTKSFMDDVLQKGFNPWSFDLSSWEQAGITAQNIHSFFPRMMMASDELLSQLNYRSIMRAKAQQLVDNEVAAGLLPDTAEAIAKRVDTKFQEIAFSEAGFPKDFKAFAEAKDILFQVPLNRKLYDPVSGEKVDVSSQVARTNLTKIGQQFQSLSENCPPLKLIFPFIKTPTNIAQSAIETNPLYMALSPDFKARLVSTDPMVKAKARGHLALVSMMHMAGLFMAGQGLITGSEPLDQKEKTALLKTGWRPYSFYINGQYISYKNYVPFDSLLASCADFANITGRVMNPDIQSGFDDIFARSMASVLNNYIDQAGFRTNSEKLLDILNPSLDTRRREQLLAGLLTGYVPMGSVIRDAQSFLNPEVTKGENFYERALKNIAPNIVQADYVRDVFGRRTDIHNYFLTQTTDDDFDSPEYLEMQRLAELGWTPQTLKGIVEETKVPFHDYRSTITGRSASDALGEELYNAKIDGKTLRQAVAELSQDPDYQALPVGITKNPEQDWGNSDYDTQIKEMTLLFKEYYDEAKNKIIDERASEFVNSKGETMEETTERVQSDMDKLINLY